MLGQRIGHGASMSKAGKYSLPNLVNSSTTLPPYKDLIGGGDGGPSTRAANGVPPPPYCLYPPHAKPALPAPLPPMASPPGASPPAGSPTTSIAPGIISPPPPAFMPPVAFPEPPPRGPPGQARPRLWCVANPKAASAVVQTAMDYTCGSGAGCGTAAPGGQCYLPDTLATHASYAFNSYYHKNPVPTSCDFGGTATITTTDPSKLQMHFLASLIRR